MNAEVFSAGEPLVAVTRGGLTESVHYGHVVLASADGQVVHSLGDPDTPTFMRSCAKPLQALPVIESSAADKYGLTDIELAAMCGSLNGQDFQVEVVRSILAKIGLDETYLRCGPQRPSHRPTAKAMQQAGESFGAIHNNCAAKHTAMLTLCANHGWDVSEYERPYHPVQKLILSVISECCGVAVDEIGIGVDGCGVPVFQVPLSNLAMAYAGLADPEGAGWAGSRVSSTRRLMSAALAHPEMIAGDERLCTALMRASRGRILAKVGGEGSYGVAWPEKGLGLAVKVTDGAMRALGPVMVEILSQIGVFGDAEVEELKAWQNSPVKNHRGEVVGVASATRVIANDLKW